MPSQAMGDKGYYVYAYVPMYVPLSKCPRPTSAFFSLRTNIELNSMKFGRNHYHQHERNCTRDKEQDSTTEYSNRRQTGAAT